MEKEFNEKKAEELEDKLKELFCEFSPIFGNEVVVAMMLRISIGILFYLIKDRQEFTRFIHTSIELGMQLGNKLKQHDEEVENV